MSINIQREGHSSSGSELSGSSDDGAPLYLVSRKKMKTEVESMVTRAVEKLVVPLSESLIRKVVNEEIQSALMTHGNGNRTHEATMSTESRTLKLKFLDEVCLPVLTGKVIKGKGDTDLRLAIIDDMTRKPVTSWPKASAKVEVLLLEAHDDDNEHNWSTEDFNTKIIRESDKEKPHISEGVYVYLEKGVAILSNVKLGHGSSWQSICFCRLGARLVDNSNGNRVKEAWTESFKVEDQRGKLNAKHHPPVLSDEVWRLEKIRKNGERCKRLYKENIRTVQDLLFSLSADPQKLKIIFGDSKDWKATVEHARTCNIDDKKIYLYKSPSKFNFDVAFDAVGQLMGIARDSHFVHLDNLCEVEKASARELLLLAFKNREDITFVDDETYLVQQIPYVSPDVGVATSSSTIPLGSNEGLCDPSQMVPYLGPLYSPDNFTCFIEALPDSPDVLCDMSQIVTYSGPLYSLDDLDFCEPSCDQSSTVPEQASIHRSTDLDDSFKHSGDNEQRSLFYGDNNNCPNLIGGSTSGLKVNANKKLPKLIGGLDYLGSDSGLKVNANKELPNLIGGSDYWGGSDSGLKVNAKKKLPKLIGGSDYLGGSDSGLKVNAKKKLPKLIGGSGLKVNAKKKLPKLIGESDYLVSNYSVNANKMLPKSIGESDYRGGSNSRLKVNANKKLPILIRGSDSGLKLLNDKTRSAIHRNVCSCGLFEATLHLWEIVLGRIRRW